MRVSALQFRPERDPHDPVGARDRNRTRLMNGAAELLAAHPADLVVFPEMAASGYLFSDPDAVSAVAEPADGPTVQALARLCRAQGCFGVLGFAESDGGRLYNSAAVSDPHGDMVAVYRKRLLYEADAPWATAGDRPYPVVDTGEGRFTVGICMDLNDDVFTEHVGRSGVEVVAFPTNWVDDGDEVWSYWAWRLRDTSAALVAANRWGSERADDVAEGPTHRDAGVTRFSGASCVLQWLDHEGARRPTVLAALKPEGDGGLWATV